MSISFSLNNFSDHLIIYSLIILITYILFKIFKNKTSASFRYKTWIIILLLTLLPFKINLNIENNSLINNSNLISYINSDNILFNQLNLINIFEYLLILYFVVFIILLSYQIYRYYAFNKIINRWSNPVRNNQAIMIFEKVIKELNLEKRKISLINVKSINPPLTTRIFRPIIVIPENISDKDLYYIIKHEAIHIKRYDVIIKYISNIILTIFWFNPFIYLLIKRLDSECEISCDSQVVKSFDIDYKKSYINTIINTIESSKNYSYSTQFLYNKKDIEYRIISLLKSKNTNTRFSIFISLVLFLSISLFAISVDNTLDKKANISIKNINSTFEDVEFGDDSDEKEDNSEND